MRDLYLLDTTFLEQLIEQYSHKVYAKVIALTQDELPIAEITGNVTQGNITVDGSSAVRRTCNLTLVTSSIDINNVDWSLHTKFKLSIGLENYIDSKYDDIIWFKQGTYVITSFSSTLNNQGYQISIQGKDKMCKLNGEVGGTLSGSHDFGKLEIQNGDGTITYEPLAVKEIIREAVHQYGLEPYANIIINDVDNIAIKLMDYKKYHSPAYVVTYMSPENEKEITSLEFVDSSPLAQELEEKYNKGELNDSSVIIKYDENTNLECKVFRLDYGDSAGYEATELTYAGDLITNIGETLTSMLDKIKNMLGDYEYFYDLDGRFIFQRQPVSYYQSWNNIQTTNTEQYVDPAASTSASTYHFKKGLLIESFQNKPNINNIKNDISVWGVRTASNGEIKVFLRYAIDDKPKSYYSLSQEKWYHSTEIGGPYDWRELIYQMAVDNNIFHGKLETRRQQVIEKAKEQLMEESKISMPDDKIMELYLFTWNKGYDIYYPEILSFWRQLYNTDIEYFEWSADGILTVQEGRTQYHYIATLSQEKWQAYKENNYWNPDHVYCAEDNSLTFTHPETMNFWLEFIDPNSDIGKFSIKAIGHRPKVVNDSDVKAIYFRETPPILLVPASQDLTLEQKKAQGYVIINIPSYYEEYFDISSKGKSAKDEMDNLLYTHTYYQDSITISSIPVYHLEPNTRITVTDEKSGIYGDYLIKSFSLPLTHDGMMSITASRAVTRII